jgi:hypothetical protein
MITGISKNTPSMNARNRKAMNIHKTIITLSFALVAGIGCNAEQAAAPGTNDSTNQEIDLAQPQPEVPLCSRCNLTKAGGWTFNDDELSIEIDSSYNGEVTGAMLTTWNGAGTPKYTVLDSEVIYDINDPYTEETIVHVHAPFAVTAQLTWTHTGGTQINPVSVE